MAHNGNLVNAEQLRNDLEAAGSIFQTTSDTEVVVHLMARARTEHRPGTPRAPARPRCARRSAKVAGRLLAWSSSPRRRWSACATPWASGRSCSGRLKGQLRARQRDHRARPHRGRVHPRGRAGRAGGDRRDRLPHRAALRRPRRRSGPAAASSSTSTSPAPTRSSSASRSTPARARLRRAGSPSSTRPRPTWSSRCPTRACRRPSATPRQSGHPLRHGARPLPLRGAHLHRAAAVDPPLRREAEAERGEGRAEGQAGGGGRRLDRARHHLAARS